MVTLNARLDDYLAWDWRQDLTPLWRELFEGVGPNMDEPPDGDVPEVFPPCLALRRAREPEDVPSECHMLRAFDGLTPDRVRVVIIGRDPYPRPDRKTGGLSRMAHGTETTLRPRPSACDGGFSRRQLINILTWGSPKSKTSGKGSARRSGRKQSLLRPRPHSSMLWPRNACYA